MQIVNHVYPRRCLTLDKPPGLGDYLRGSLALAHHVRERGWQLRLDFSRHPLGKFINPRGGHAGTDRGIEPPVDEFFDDRATLIYDWLDDLPGDGQAYACTNLLPHESRIDETTRQMVLSQLDFVPAIRETAATIHAQISPREFAAVHIRVADEDFKTDKTVTGRLLHFIERDVLPTWGKRVALFSNNLSIKRSLSERYGLLYIDTGAVHLGECDSSDTDVRDTLVDFALLGRSSRIYSHSAYSWKSGFSHWCATLHGIPFEKARVRPPGLMGLARTAAQRIRGQALA